MPLSTNPNRTTHFWLDVDDALPRAMRPMFVVRFMSDDEHDRHAELMELARVEPDTARTLELVVEAITVGVVGWVNMPDPADPERKRPLSWSIDNLVGGLLTRGELWELAWGYPEVVKLQRDDRKNSRSAAPSVTAQPAAGARSPAARA